jgi:hypothetical protein
MFKLSACGFALLGTTMINSTTSAAPPALTFEYSIPLGDVKGRIDHLAVDLERQRLFVAELGNNSVGVIDLQSRRVRQRLSDLDEPQGLGYLSATRTLYVASGGDGSVQTYTGDPLKRGSMLKLGGDADNIRIDKKTCSLFVGYGTGAIAVIDAATLRKIREVPLDGHPESFQLASRNNHIYVNVPDAQQIVIADRSSGHVVEKVEARGPRANFPMALDEQGRRLLTAFRDPPVLRALTLEGMRLTDVDICRDADDVFVDRKRHRTYVICGQGVVDVLDHDGSRVQRIPTAAGARTGLFVPELDRLFVAVPARTGTAAEIRVLAPPDTISTDRTPKD